MFYLFGWYLCWSRLYLTYLLELINISWKVLRNIVNAPWYIRNSDLHRDLEVDVVSSEIQRFVQMQEERPHHHENVETIQLLDNMGIVRRLQRKKPFELVKW